MALLEFYGKECPHCLAMAPLVEQLKGEGIVFEQFEVWHDKENAEKLKEYDHGKCGGVPFFINTDTSEWICGEDTYEALKKLAEGVK